MRFFQYVLEGKRQRYVAAILFVIFTILYFCINLPYVLFMNEQEGLLQQYSPFYGVPFTLNIFNFDPSLYYSFNPPTIIHPFLNFISSPLAHLSQFMSNHYFFLTVQSMLNAASCALFYIYLSKQKVALNYALIFSVLFGASSYLLYTSLIPDSYVYAQFLLITSVLYLQYCRHEDTYPVIILGFLGFLNFGISATNMIPFFIAVLISLYKKGDFRNNILAVIKIGVAFLLSTAVFTVVQYFLFGETFLGRLDTLNSGGFSYVAPFSWVYHWKAVIMLFVSPIITPAISLIDQGIVAFATDISVPYSAFTYIAGAAVLILGLLAIYYCRRSKNTWVLLSFILFAILLHLVIGYGIGAFKYDLYLYAGHFLFAQLLLTAQLSNEIKSRKVHHIYMTVIAVVLVITVINNVILHTVNLDSISDAYLHMQS